MFDEGKVAQMAAYFLNQAGGELRSLRLMNLIYLADREAMNQFGYSLSDDDMVSTPIGPALNHTWQLLSGQAPKTEIWKSWISVFANNSCRLRREFTREAMDLLSKIAFETIRHIWADFGHFGQDEIALYVRANCKEWSASQASGKAIAPQSVFIALGKSPEIAAIMASELIANRREREALARNELLHA